MKNKTRFLKKENFGFYFLALILAVVIIILNLLAPGKPANEQRFLASFVLVLSFIPILICVKRGEPGIPFLALFGLIYGVYYALPIFTLKNHVIGLTVINEGALGKALQLAALGLPMLLFSYYKLPGKSIKRYAPKISIFWDYPKARLWGVVMIICGLGSSFLSSVIHVPLAFAQVFNFLFQLPLIGMGILFMLQMKGALDLRMKLLLWGVFLPIYILIVLGTGSLIELLLAAIFFFFIYWNFKHKIPWKMLFCVILFSALLLSVKYEFRLIAWAGAKKEANFIEKGLLFVKFGSQAKDSYSKVYKTVVDRTGYNLLTFGQVVDFTPALIPYSMGKTYLAILWAPLPRVIFPWKPKMALGQEFGHRYSLLNPSDHVTSYNLAQLIEMYMNFGIIGVIVGMFLMGVIYRFFYEIFCHPEAGEGGLLIGFFIFSRIANIESDFSIVFANVLYFIIPLIIINWFISNKGKSKVV
jgi:hypothetical protein